MNTITQRKMLTKARPSSREVHQLERLERERWAHFHFLRESPKDQTGIPFAKYAKCSPVAAIVSCIVIVAVLALASKVAL